MSQGKHVPTSAQQTTSDYVVDMIASGAWPEPGSPEHLADVHGNSGREAYVSTPPHGTPGAEHPDHPAVIDGGYRGASSVIGEAVLADSVRTSAHALPTDSAERKRTPLCTGLLDYAPDALIEIAEQCTNFSAPENTELAILDCLMKRGDDTCAQSTIRGAFYALLMLEEEIIGDIVEYDAWRACFSVLDLFAVVPHALAAVAQVSWHGNEKHNPGQELHHARDKSRDHADCILRHLVEAGGFDGPFRHTAAQAWRWLILAQLEREAAGAPKARGAK